MSGIFGIVHLDGSPAQEAELRAMRAAMQEWGPDAGAIWSDGPAGLGNLVSFDTPEAVHESSPLHSAQGFILTAEARLDNRDELCTELAIPAAEGSRLADGHLVLHAYEKWGAASPSHLLGDWSFAAWHPGQRRLFLARDHFGNTALYYFHDERRLAFASSRKALFALGIPRRLNEFYLACVLVSWTAHHGLQTIELDVHRLPPAHTLSLADRSLQVVQYWRLEDTPELRLHSSQEYIEGLLAVYDRAVRDRLRSSGAIGISMSGGLDSGSTAVLAARALRESGRRLRSYTAVPVHDVGHATGERSFGDEWLLAQATAEGAGNVDAIPIPAMDITPIQGIKAALEVHAEPGHAASNVFWIREILRTARNDGVRVLLTGQGGNATVSWSGVDHATTFKRYLRSRMWGRAAQILVYPRVPLGLIRLFRRWRHRRGLDWSRTSINPEFARRIDLSGQFIAHSGDWTRVEEWYPPRRHRYGIIRPGASIVGTIWAENGAAYGLDVRDATLDKRVMEFAISIPDREFFGPDGTNRWVLRAAMQGMLPDQVRLNRRLGMQAADISHRLVASASEVEGTLADLERSELVRSYLDVPHLRNVWESIQQEVGLQSTQLTISILTRGILAGLHLLERERLA